MKKPWMLLGTHKYTFLILALFVCLPAILLEYGMHDDYRYLGANIDKKNVWNLHTDMSHGIAMGRPIAMFFIGIQSLFTNRVNDFIWQRFAFFILTLLSALLVYYYLTRRLLLDSFFASALVFCIFALPQSQFFIIWAVWSVFAGPALLLAIISYLIFDYAWNNYFVFRRWKSYAIYLSISFCVFLISLYDYPVMTLFFLVFSCANILFSKLDVWPKTRIRVIHEILFCCFGMAVYFISYKLIYLPLVVVIFPHLKDVLSTLGYHSVTISMDLPLKIKQFYVGSILSFGGIFHPFLDHASALFVFIILVVGSSVVLLGYWFYPHKLKTLENKEQLLKLKWIFQMFFTVVIILPLSITPILAAGGGFTYRVLFPYSAIIVLFMFWLLNRLSHLFVIRKAQLVTYSVALFMVIVFGALAQTYMLNTALSANRELKFIRQKLTSIDFSKVNMLICEQPFNRPPKELEGALGEVRGFPVFGDFPQRHDYDHMATNRSFVVEIFHAVLAEMGVKPNIFIASYESDLYYSSAKRENVCIINMNDIVTPVAKDTLVNKQRVEGPIKNIKASQFVVFKLFSQADGWNIFNFYPNFWEETGEFPHWVNIEFSDSKVITEYALQTGPYGEDDTGRIPQDWLLQGSDDGEKWVDLDKRNSEMGWRNNEKRVYKIINPSAFKFYQLYCIKGNNSGIIRMKELGLRFL